MKFKTGDRVRIWDLGEDEGGPLFPHYGWTGRKSLVGIVKETKWDDQVKWITVKLEDVRRHDDEHGDLLRWIVQMPNGEPARVEKVE